MLGYHLHEKGCNTTVVMPFKHKYSKQNLSFDQLKGIDHVHASHVTRSCAKTGHFVTLLANTILRINDSNSEEDLEKDFTWFLSHIVDESGDFLVGKNHEVKFSHGRFLFNPWFEDRAPDNQTGGEYMGNQYCDIDQFFNDSVCLP